MTKYIPKWRSIKEELNRFILSHAEWADCEEIEIVEGKNNNG
jgi:hypothetical protein